jgi:hypothetical protein
MATKKRRGECRRIAKKEGNEDENARGCAVREREMRVHSDDRSRRERERREGKARKEKGGEARLEGRRWVCDRGRSQRRRRNALALLRGSELEAKSDEDLEHGFLRNRFLDNGGEEGASLGLDGVVGNDGDDCKTREEEHTVSPEKV